MQALDVDIAGVVAELDGGSPLGGARIDATDLLGAPLATTFSCATGAYELTGLLAGPKQPTEVIVTISAQGFEGSQETVTIGAQHDVSLGKSIIPSFIVGSVRSAALAESVEGARVQVQPSRGITSITRVTGPDGVFTFTNLENGNYAIRVSAQGFQAKTVNKVLSGGSVRADVTLVEGETLAPGAISLPPPAGCFAGGAFLGSTEGKVNWGDFVFLAFVAAVLCTARRRRVPRPL